MKLTAEQLSFSYGKRKVLDGVSFELRQGEVLCVLGPNGVGKSTLFRCGLGLLRSYTGSVRLGEEEVRLLRPAELARRIAYIPQTSVPVFDYTVFHTVLMGTTARLGPFASPGKQQEAAAEAALERLGIPQLRDRPVGALSGGERQLVCIARALAQDSPLLVMDEPTASLDYGNTVRVMELIRGLAENGYGILLSTHDPDQVLRYATRVLVLGGGGVRSFGPPEEALTPALLSELYGVPIEIAQVRTEGGLHRVCVPGK